MNGPVILWCIHINVKNTNYYLACFLLLMIISIILIVKFIHLYKIFDVRLIFFVVLLEFTSLESHLNWSLSIIFAELPRLLLANSENHSFYLIFMRLYLPNLPSLRTYHYYSSLCSRFLLFYLSSTFLTNEYKDCLIILLFFNPKLLQVNWLIELVFFILAWFKSDAPNTTAMDSLNPKVV